jgi:small-conductance mechanosensitive channel
LLFAVLVAAGLILRRILFKALRNWSARTQSKLGDLVIDTLRGPTVLWTLVLAVHIALQHSAVPPEYRRYIHPTLEVLWLGSLISAASRLAGRAIRIYGEHVTGTQSVTSLTEKLAQTVIVVVGIIWLLKVVFDLSLAPVLTTLGVGGLAVALALQDTLSNLFAGFYVSLSGLVRIGDYIKLNTGEEGYVTDITWRCTTMRTVGYNLVVVPNNKLGQAIYTNYFLPEPRMMMSVNLGVSYDSDIDRVEAILLDAARSGVGTLPGLLGDPAPTIRFNPGPGDWALVFQINFHVSKYSDQFLVQSEMRKILFKRLQKEGIEMPFPTQTIRLEGKA